MMADNNETPQLSLFPSTKLMEGIARMPKGSARLYTATQPIADLMRTSAQLRGSIETGSLASVARLERDLAQLTQGILGTPDWVKKLSSLQGEAKQWGALGGRLHKLAQHQEAFARQASFATTAVSANLARYGDLVEAMSLQASHPKFMERMAAPAEYLSRYSRTTLQEMGALSDPTRARVLDASLVFANDQFAAMTKLMSDPLELPSGPDLSVSVPSYNLFELTRDDLLTSATDPGSDDLEEMFAGSGTAMAAVDVRRIIELWGNCNDNARMHGDPAVFSPTNATVVRSHDLGYTAARDRRSFGAVVDALYTLLYEGAGSDNLRFLERDYVNDADCGVIWRIKHFRNCWLRHDPEHGSPSNQKQKKRKLREALNAYGFNRKPSEPREFAELHRKLIRDVRDFLSLLERNIP